MEFTKDICVETFGKYIAAAYKRRNKNDTLLINEVLSAQLWVTDEENKFSHKARIDFTCQPQPEDKAKRSRLAAGGLKYLDLEDVIINLFPIYDIEEDISARSEFKLLYV